MLAWLWTCSLLVAGFLLGRLDGDIEVIKTLQVPSWDHQVQLLAEGAVLTTLFCAIALLANTLAEEEFKRVRCASCWRCACVDTLR